MNPYSDTFLFYVVNLLSEERNQHARCHRRSDDTGNIAGHTIVQHMVFGIILGCNFITYPARHRHSTQSRCTDQRINLLLGEQVKQLHEEDTARNGQSECKETTDDDADSSPVEERLARHGSTHTQSRGRWLPHS